MSALLAIYLLSLIGIYFFVGRATASFTLGITAVLINLVTGFLLVPASAPLGWLLVVGAALLALFFGWSTK